MYSRNTHNINDIFEEFITVFNTFPVIKKCNKTNILEIHFKPRKDILIIFTCDPNDINTITYKQVQELCIQNKIQQQRWALEQSGFVSNKNSASFLVDATIFFIVFCTIGFCFLFY